ncbi:MAG: zinc finger domain-containing protein [Thermoplasmata archaeon]
MIARVDLRCSSCGRGLAGRGATAFLCPSCGIETIGRDARCRDQSVPYKCKNCGFVGP